MKKKKITPLYVVTARKDYLGHVRVEVEYRTLIAALKYVSQSLKNNPKTIVTIERVR